MSAPNRVTYSPRIGILFFLPRVCWSRETMQGLVKFFNVERGFGFVHNEAGSWWFHRSYCRGDPPAAGDTVEFWLDDGTRGDLVAVDVTVVPTDSTA